MQTSFEVDTKSKMTHLFLMHISDLIVLDSSAHIIKSKKHVFVIFYQNGITSEASS